MALLDDGSLSAGHGRALLAADDPAALADKVVARALNVRATERLVKKAGRAAAAGADAPAAPAAPAAAKDADTRALEKQLSERLGLTVAIDHAGEHGVIRIAFQTLDQFDDIIARLTRDP